jgi:GNAT superfamily N-acetyltransferase
MTSQMTSTSGRPIASDVTLRDARPSDVGRIVELLARSAEEQGSLDALCVDTDILLREGFGEHPRFHAIVADANGQVVAIAVYFFTFSTWTSVNGLHLEDLYVARDWRRRGIARALMEKLAAVAAEHGCRRFQWFVLRDNRDAIRFYESLGATVADEWRLMQLGSGMLDRR